MQSSADKGLRVGGERILCRRSNLSLHMGKGKSGGSVGWVMHEYTIAAPPCPSPVKICHITFTGHGRKRKRVPDGQEDCAGEHASRRARVEAAAAGGRSSGEMQMLGPDSGEVVHASADQERSQLVLTDDDMFPQSPLLGSSDFLDFPSAASANAEQYQELEQQVPSTEEEQVPNTAEEEQQQMPQLMVQQSGMVEQLSAGELEFWSSIGVDMFKALTVLSRSSGAPKGSPLWSRNVCSAVRVAEEHSSIESATKAPGPPPCKLQPRRRQLPCAPLVLLRARRATRAEQRHCWRERLKGKRRPESGGGPLRRAGELRKLHGRTSGRARGDHGGRRGWRAASARQTKRADGAE